jgi:hypothetical protein
MEGWIDTGLREVARMVRHALGSWGRTIRLCVLTMCFALVVGALLRLL